LKLNKLCNDTSTDVSTLAIVNEQTNTTQWRYVFGNTNERYKHMLAKTGKDLSGTIIGFGLIIDIDKETHDYEKKRLEYQIMLAEKLHSAIAAPIVDNGIVKAVLLIGSRAVQKFTTCQIAPLLVAAHEFSQPIEML